MDKTSKLEIYNKRLDVRIEDNKELNSKTKNIFVNVIFTLCLVCPFISYILYLIISYWRDV